MLCKKCKTSILYDVKKKEWYSPSIIVSMACPKHEPEKDMIITVKTIMTREVRRDLDDS